MKSTLITLTILCQLLIWSVGQAITVKDLGFNFNVIINTHYDKLQSGDSDINDSHTRKEGKEAILQGVTKYFENLEQKWNEYLSKEFPSITSPSQLTSDDLAIICERFKGFRVSFVDSINQIMGENAITVSRYHAYIRATSNLLKEKVLGILFLSQKTPKKLILISSTDLDSLLSNISDDTLRHKTPEELVKLLLRVKDKLEYHRVSGRPHTEKKTNPS